jgi:hypothetical protein
MRIVYRLAALVRVTAAILGAAALWATTAATYAQGEFDPTRFFGYFTIQSNGILVVVLLAAGVVALRRRDSASLVWLRAAATTYMVIVGAVYNTLLAADNDHPLVPWANTLLHVVLPLYAAIDWLLIGDRPPLAWRWMPLVLVYPLVWTAVTVVRGLVEPHPFFPYPFLDPATTGGYGGVGLYVLGIAVAFTVTASLIWLASRIRVLRP